MTTFRDMIGRTSSAPVSIGPVPAGDEAARREAIAVMLTGRARAGDPAVDHFMSYAAQQGLSLDHLWAAWRGGTPVAATMLLPCAGRTGMLFVSPVKDAGAAEITTDLVRTACGAFADRGLSLVQALLELGNGRERDALLAAGFHALADLVYMVRRAPRAPMSPALPAGVELLPWDPAHRDLFGRTILASYEHTRDCPELVGLREVDDILDGHQAAGVFEPSLWHVALWDGEPAAVMLINSVPNRPALELVYLGLTPAFRGRGLARAMLALGLDLLRARGASEMVLAVDGANEPAVKLYRSMKFVPQTRKHALIRPFGSA